MKKLVIDGLELMIPEHVGFIMDGNGRWAKERGLVRTDGHHQGILHVEDVLEICIKYEIKTASVYIFSSENWNRPKEEINTLFNWIVKLGPGLATRINKRGVQLRHIGSRDGLNQDILKVMDDALKLTQKNKGYALNLIFNYSGRHEITLAAQKIIASGISPEEVTEELVSKYLYTNGLPDVDLVIRSAGELRMSNFLIWQTANAVFYSSKLYWPDLNEEEIVNALKHFTKLNSTNRI